MAYNTREKLIEVARQLFAHKGLENTTMNDIATASDKGRRTVYTYFKNKKDIYDAVIESESDKIVAALREIAFSSLPADEKLRDFLNTRLSQVKSVSSSFFNIKSWLRLDVRRVEKVRILVKDKEAALLQAILDEGIAAGKFDKSSVEMFNKFIADCIHGMDLVDFSGDSDMHSDEVNRALSDFLVKGIQINN